MLTQSIQLLLDVFLKGYASILLLRFLLQWLRVPLRNSLGQFITAVTDFMVLRVRRFVPSIWLLDTATLLLALLTEMLYVVVTLALQGNSLGLTAFPSLLFLSTVKLIIMSVQLLMVALIVQAILSWVNPHTPIAPMLAAITQRFLRPLQRVIPLVGKVDLSPLILIVICQIILFAPLAMLESFALRLLG